MTTVEMRIMQRTHVTDPATTTTTAPAAVDAAGATTSAPTTAVPTAALPVPRRGARWRWSRCRAPGPTAATSVLAAVRRLRAATAPTG